MIYKDGVNDPNPLLKQLIRHVEKNLPSIVILSVSEESRCLSHEIFVNTQDDTWVASILAVLWPVLEEFHNEKAGVMMSTLTQNPALHLFVSPHPSQRTVVVLRQLSLACLDEPLVSMSRFSQA